jgi:hypothetical protein
MRLFYVSIYSGWEEVADWCRHQPPRILEVDSPLTGRSNQIDQWILVNSWSVNSCGIGTWHSIGNFCQCTLWEPKKRRESKARLAIVHMGIYI